MYVHVENVLRLKQSEILLSIVNVAVCTKDTGMGLTHPTTIQKCIVGCELFTSSPETKIIVTPDRTVHHCCYTTQTDKYILQLRSENGSS